MWTVFVTTMALQPCTQSWNCVFWSKLRVSLKMSVVQAREVGKGPWPPYFVPLAPWGIMARWSLVSTLFSTVCESGDLNIQYKHHKLFISTNQPLIFICTIVMDGNCLAFSFADFLKIWLNLHPLLDENLAHIMLYKCFINKENVMKKSDVVWWICETLFQYKVQSQEPCRYQCLKISKNQCCFMLC